MLRGHTRHPRYEPATTGSGRCTTCHMVGTAGNAARGDVTAHTFRTVPPHESARMAAAGQAPIPNSCDGCHGGDADLCVARYESRFGVPMERPGR